MRVLHVGKYFSPCPGGIERLLSDLMGAQKRAGVAVGAVVHDHRFGKGTTVEDVGGCPLWRVRTFGSLLYAPVSPSFPLALRRAIGEFKPDVLHVHVPNTSAFWAMGSKLPMVTHWHSDVVPSRIDRRLAVAYQAYRPVERRLLKRSAAIIATSQRYLDSSAALKPFRAKCHVVPLGIDPARLPQPSDEAMRWAARQWPADSRCRVLTIGRLTYYKGQRYLIDAIGRDDGLSLCMVGQGDLRLPLEDQVVRLNLTQRVNMAGYVDDDRMAALLAACDVFCLSSIERTEAFGIVLLEAMRYGKPIVAADVPGSGVGFVVEDEVNGLLVATEDGVQLAAALGRLASDGDLAARLGAEGRRRFEAGFCIDAVAQAVGEVYEQVGR